MPNEEKKVTETKIMKDFKKAYSMRSKWLKAAKKDYNFTLGKQWDDNDVESLRQIGVKAITINKIQPNIFMVSGNQRQNRSDFIAYPVGQEDAIEAEIATRLLKNLIKRTDTDYKSSEQFEDGIICGEGWLESYIDYTYDLANGELKLKKLDISDILPDPYCTEYSLEDAKYVIKYTTDLTKEQLYELFPNNTEEIDNIENGKINLDSLMSFGPHIQPLDYPQIQDDNVGLKENEYREKVYDLIEYYYKKPIKKHLIVSLSTGDIIEEEDLEKAKMKVEILNRESEIIGKRADTRLVTRYIPEIWCAKMIGSNSLISDEQAWTYPRYKSFPFIPFKAHFINTKLTDIPENRIMGISRSLEDPQEEYNKRRTQEMRHINQVPNSGWQVEENSVVNMDALTKFGGSPGVVIIRKKGAPAPEKILPSPLSQGHAQMALEHSQDMKEISGINADLLSAQTGETQSGRAIFLRQKQGLVMIQRIMDNFRRTQRLLGQFLLTMLGEIYNTDEAIKVLGKSFIEQNFITQVMVEDPATGTTVPQPQINMQLAIEKINNVLQNTDNLKKYDVEIGEGSNSLTAKITNQLILQDMITAGIPIPPDVLIDESMLDNATKEKIKQSIAKAQQSQMQQPKK